MKRGRRRRRGSGPGVFRRALAGPVALAQAFGLMPVGAHSPGRGAHPAWRLLGAATALASALGLLALTAAGAYWFWIDKSLFRATKVVFHGSGAVACLLMARVGRAWPRLVRSWTHAELATSHIGYSPRTVLFCRAVFAAYFLLAVAEHSMAVATAVGRAAVAWPDVPRHLFARWFPQLTAVPLAYSPALALPVFLLNLVATLTFSFLDLLVTDVALCLAAMFAQYGVHLRRAAGREPGNSEWAGLRRDYQVLRRLAYVVDDHISPLVLLSFVINLYHICLQLYLSLMPAPSAFGRVYFWASFAFLVARTGAVCASASAVNESAAAPRAVLFAVPDRLYCQEVERFLFQVCNDEVAISGLQSFFITRVTIVKVLGLVVTYEVVMFQIHSKAEDEDDRVNAKEALFVNESNQLCI